MVLFSSSALSGKETGTATASGVYWFAGLSTGNLTITLLLPHSRGIAANAPSRQEKLGNLQRGQSVPGWRAEGEMRTVRGGGGA